VTTQGVAIAAGASLPEGVGLHVAAPLALAGLLAKTVSGRPTAVAAAVAALVAVAGIGLPFQASVLLASVSGVVAGAVAGDPASKETS
jgi:predicted branched-subunit amino acid permease